MASKLIDIVIRPVCHYIERFLDLPEDQGAHFRFLNKMADIRVNKINILLNDPEGIDEEGQYRNEQERYPGDQSYQFSFDRHNI